MLGGCVRDHVQSALHPAGPNAEAINLLWWILFGTCGVVFLATMLLLAFAIFRKRQEDDAGPPLGGTRFVVLSGVILPSLILLFLLLASLRTSVALRPPEPTVVIDVVGYRWWWDVHYPDFGIRTANEIHIPVGEPVRLRIRTGDVIHSFWVPNLHGKMDLLPEHWNRLNVRASRSGVFYGQCAEFCGVQHALMAFRLVAMPREEFQAWVAQRRSAAEQSDTPQFAKGRQVFFDAGCNTCHAIRGTAAEARIGPDLTHLASRLTLGAGTIPNTRGNLGGWIVNPQAIKPGNLMPPTYLEPEQLHALLDYLESLH